MTDDADNARIGPDDPRYRAVVEKRFNKRFLARPDYVRLAASTGDVVAAVDDAVREKRRLVVTSGGHCLEGFVSDPDVRVIVDVSPMKRVYHDVASGAIAVEAGATVGEAFRVLHETWGVVVPLGEYPQIGVGGHVAGGAFGFLCRQLGLAADYLHAVEVVTVDADGHARVVVGTREPSDENHDLWWAHTGAGGGNFGIVTRYWFRAPDATGDDPAALLPRSPESITTFKASWSWSRIDRPAFVRLVVNFGAWCERNAGADSPNASLWALLELHREQFGTIVVRGVSTAGDDAERQADELLAALGDGVGAPNDRELARMSWLAFALDPMPDLFAAPPGGVSVKVKDALIKRRLDDRQIAVAYEHLTSADSDVMGGMLGLATYGGRINVVPSDATASAQRDAIIDLACSTGWMDAKDEAKNLAWVRAFYHDLFAETGGVPVPNDANAGTFINHPDTDLADPALNTSGVPWHTLYFQSGYPRLQRAKARWDPGNVFRHALSIRAEDADERSTRTTRLIAATPERIYAAFLDPDALVQWLPPAEMTGRIHEFDARVGGGYRMSLYYPATEQHARGKTAEREDMVRVRFVELTAPRRIVEAIQFVTDDPALQGEMTLTATFDAVEGGTEVTMLFTDLPPGLRPEDNDKGARLSLEQLARLFV